MPTRYSTAGDDPVADNEKATEHRKTLRSLAEMAGLTSTSEADDSAALAQVAERFAIAITPAMADLIDPENPADPIALQFLPDRGELETHPDESTDPIGDAEHSPLSGIVHRYPDRVLLTPLKICAVYCRFCFRRETVGQSDQAVLGEADLAAALDYIREHTEIWEVILSGGDPLLLSARRLASVISQLASMPHVRVIRVHTRLPVVAPERIDSELISALKQGTTVYTVLHTNHPRELTDAALDACARIIDAGIPMLSQSVLLKNVNDDPRTLEALLRKLVENRIKPYYLHHADKAEGTSHFRTTLAEGQALVRELRGRVSGLCQPTYILDIPGGAGKVPASAAWITGDGTGGYRVTCPAGKFHHYSDTKRDEPD